MEELFAKKVLISMKTSDQDNRQIEVYITMKMHVSSNPVSRKDLMIQLTDDSDLFFLHLLKLGEDEFNSLKSQQGLLVDFTSFPQKVIALLNMCIDEQSKSNPKFILQLESSSSGVSELSSSTLSIVETNPFKHLIHLSLKFFAASDSELKKHLALCLLNMKEQNCSLYQRLQNTETELNHQLSRTQEALSKSTNELERLKSSWASKMSEISSTHLEQLTAEKEKALNKLTDSQQRFDRDKYELQLSHQQSMSVLESRISDLELANKDLTDTKVRSESSNSELQSRTKLLEEENTRMKAEISTLRQQNSELDSNKHSQDKILQQRAVKIATLEQEVKDKLLVISHHNEQITSEISNKKKVEIEIDSKRKEMKRLENKVKHLADELNKGNEIIKKLQSEVKNYHEKVKLRSHIATEQEKVLAEKDHELEKVRQDLVVSKDDLSQYKNENEKLKLNLEATIQKLEESRQILKTNENVIQWLNKQINDNQIYSHSTLSESTPSTMFARKGKISTQVDFLGSSAGRSGLSESLPGSVRSNQIVQYNKGYNPSSTASHSINPASLHSTISPVINAAVPPRESQPVIDLKYLKKQKSQNLDTINLTCSTTMADTPAAHPLSSIGESYTRDNTQRTTSKLYTPPLASAYFPNKIE